MTDNPTAAAAVKSAPPVAVTLADVIMGIPIDKWVAIATLIYVLLQTFFLLKDRLKKRREKDNEAG